MNKLLLCAAQHELGLIEKNAARIVLETGMLTDLQRHLVESGIGRVPIRGVKPTVITSWVHRTVCISWDGPDGEMQYSAKLGSVAGGYPQFLHNKSLYNPDQATTVAGFLIRDFLAAEAGKEDLEAILEALSPEVE